MKVILGIIYDEELSVELTGETQEERDYKLKLIKKELKRMAEATFTLVNLTDKPTEEECSGCIHERKDPCGEYRHYSNCKFFTPPRPKVDPEKEVSGISHVTVSLHGEKENIIHKGKIDDCRICNPIKPRVELPKEMSNKVAPNGWDDTHSEMLNTINALINYLKERE